MNKFYEGYEPHEFPPDYQGKFFLEYQMDGMYEAGYCKSLDTLMFVLQEEDGPFESDSLFDLIKSLKEDIQ